MRIPFSNRMADVDLPVTPGQAKVTVKSVIDSFWEQLPNHFSDLFEAFVLLSPRKVRVTCRSPRALEEVQHRGLLFRNNAVTFNPCRTAKWVNVTRLSYGIPNDAIQAALDPFGHVLMIKMDVYQGVYIGVRHVLMEISTPIPSSLRIADHWCNVFYQGQTSTCFACKQVGHTRAACPQVRQAPPAVDNVEVVAPVFIPPVCDDPVQDVVNSVLERVLAPPLTFTAVVASDSTVTAPELKTADAGHDVGGPTINSNTPDRLVDNPPGLPPTSASSQPAAAVSDVPVGTQQNQDIKPTDQASDPPIDDVGTVTTVVDFGGLRVTDLGSFADPKVVDGDHSIAHEMDDADANASSLASSDSDYDLFEDAQRVSDSFSSSKREHASDSSSDSSESSLAPAKKLGKVIQEQLASLVPQAEVMARAASTPLPGYANDNLDKLPDFPSNTPHIPILPANICTSMDTDSTDYPLTQSTPIRKVVKAASQPSDFSMCLRKSTRPGPVVGTGQTSKSQSQSGGGTVYPS